MRLVPPLFEGSGPGLRNENAFYGRGIITQPNFLGAFPWTNRKQNNMRNITDHKVNGLNESLIVAATDEPGAGGANHVYVIHTDESQSRDQSKDKTVHLTISFQNGPILESGINGISGEALMAIQIDRLCCFQRGPYACRENALALTALEESLMWLQKRTRDRIARGVEGTNQQ